jgi:flagellar biosynthesis/type III secretory pathway protein FliH
MVYITSIEQLAIEEGMQKGMQQGLQQGIQQGMQQGRLDGKAQLFRRLLLARFGDLPSWANDRLSGADEHTLDAWTEAVLTAQSLDALLGAPRR